MVLSVRTRETARLACPVCHRPKPASQLVAAELVRGGISDLIPKEHSEWGAPGDTICLEDLNRYRARYMGRLNIRRAEELTTLERRLSSGSSSRNS